MLGYALRVASAKSLVLCQELDGSGPLGVSETVVLWSNGSVGSQVEDSEESAKLKLDKR